jgi:hypothetical protein
MNMKKILYFFILFCILGLCNCSNNTEEISDIQAYGVLETRSVPRGISSQIIFSGDHIAWFNSTTREIKFKNLNPSTNIFPVYSKIEFRIGEMVLFTADSFVTDAYSQSFTDLVIYYNVEKDKYYLDDCYPNTSTMKTSREVLQNMERRQSKWAIFLNQLKQENRLKE